MFVCFNQTLKVLLQRSFTLKGRWLNHFREVAEVIAKMAASATPATGPQDNHKMFKPKEDSVSLPKHSYWFDLWVFLVFDIMLFFFVYFLVP